MKRASFLSDFETATAILWFDFKYLRGNISRFSSSETEKGNNTEFKISKA